MDLQNIKVNILAKANYGVEIMFPQAKACGDSKAGGDSMNRNVALAHSIKEIQMKIPLNRNVALAHSINKKRKCVYKMVKEDILDTYGAKTDRVYALAKKKN